MVANSRSGFSVNDSVEFVSADAAIPFQERILGNHGTDDGSLARTYLADDVDEVAREDVHVKAVDDRILPVKDVRSLERYQRLVFCCLYSFAFHDCTNILLFFEYNE